MLRKKKKDASEETRQQKMCSLSYGPMGVHTSWGRRHLKAALKHYFVKFRLLRFSDLSYWSAGEQ